MWLPRHLLYLLPKSKLPQVPDASARALASGARTRTSAHQLLPCGVQRAPRAECISLGQPTPVLRPAVHRHCSDLAGSGCRSSSTLGRPDWRDQCSAHLGAKPVAASPYSLRHSCRRALTGPSLLDPFSLFFLPTREGPQPRLPREISGWSEISRGRRG